MPVGENSKLEIESFYDLHVNLKQIGRENIFIVSSNNEFI